MCSQAALSSPPSDASASIWIFVPSRIVEESLHILDRRGERERWNGSAVAVERHHVVAPRGAIPEHENLTPALVAEVQQFVAGPAQEAGEVEVARLKRNL